ncbi:MAG TPA: amylo-alpha-1,6-glucosidase [Elainellaceae cyanobacterium]
MTSLLVRRDADVRILNQSALPSSQKALIQQAHAILQGNWLGNSTKPAPSLYPYQWSWDSGFISMGYAHVDQDRATQELRSLFDGQWRNGLLPHIVFHTPDASAYFPGPEYWQTERSPYAPRHVATSGIVQPPVHAIAAWQIYRYAADRDRAYEFLVELFPKLVAWHHYLYRERNPNQDGLIYIRHPWESGQDNSPLWDTALQQMDLSPDMIPAYQRVDNRKVNGSQRPSDHDYDRYVYLLVHARDCNYNEAQIQKDCPFLVQDVWFNTLLVKANQDLAAIANVIGFDPTPFKMWAQQTAIGLNAKLWNPQRGFYHNYDLGTDQPIPTCVASNYTPLYAGVPNSRQVQKMVNHLLSAAFRGSRAEGWLVPTTSRQEPGFCANRYWRGPIWINLNWMLHHGLKTYGYDNEAEQIKQMSLDLVARSGFYEYFNPDTGEGLGSASFSWTAALVLDLILGQ